MQEQRYLAFKIDKYGVLIEYSKMIRIIAKYAKGQFDIRRIWAAFDCGAGDI